MADTRRYVGRREGTRNAERENRTRAQSQRDRDSTISRLSAHQEESSAGRRTLF